MNGAARGRQLDLCQAAERAADRQGYLPGRLCDEGRQRLVFDAERGGHGFLDFAAYPIDPALALVVSCDVEPRQGPDLLAEGDEAPAGVQQVLGALLQLEFCIDAVRGGSDPYLVSDIEALDVLVYIGKVEG